MLFHSVQFLLFFVGIFILYWTVCRHNLFRRNLFLLCASYLFYGWWDWRFLGLILVSSAVDYTAGIMIHRAAQPRQRLLYLWLSIGTNLGLLGVFKYFHFFVDSLIAACAAFGITLHPVSLSIILPVGISFYTFQTLSYTLDIYRKQFTPTRDVVAFFAFVSFFPQLVAGPIERARNLLPQFTRLPQLDYAQGRDACRQILWGLFKKVVIADGLAPSVDWIFSNYHDQNGTTLVIGALFFAFQIYGDFSGYSDMAVGLARLLGFRLTQNFAFPYFSTNLATFWRRWHISLSSWFRDYVFIPLGGSYPDRASTPLGEENATLPTVSRLKIPLMHGRNILITFLISGLWHGANWTFVAWGLLHGIAYLLSLCWKPHKRTLATSQLPAGIRAVAGLVQCGLTFSLVTCGWILFRSASMTDAYQFICLILSEDWLSSGIPPPNDNFILYSSVRSGSQAIAFLLIIEWFHRQKAHGLALSDQVAAPVRWGLYAVIIHLILLFSDHTEPFIYFQF